MHDLIKQSLEEEFGTKAQIQGDTVKTTVPIINGNAIMGLAHIYRQRGVKDVELKRSGTNITILVTV